MKCFDLFAGCGGMSLGFANAGFDIVGAMDNWQPAINVYRANFSHPIFMQDIKNESEAIAKIKSLDFVIPEVIIGGPPCQDFSSAGKRDIKNGRADLTYSFANIVCHIKPQIFVMENVDQIKKNPILLDVIAQFEKEGYGLTAVILNAAYCGVPQARTRFFLIGRLGGLNNELFSVLQKSLSTTPLTIRSYCGNRFNLNHYYRHPRNYNRRGIFSIDEPSPTIRGVNRPIPAGYKLNPSDPQIDLHSIRPLTTLERGILQTFPDSFIFEGTKTNLEQMIGNAVPVKLAEFIATAIKIFLENNENEEYQSKKINLKDCQEEMFGFDLKKEVIIPDTALKP